MRKFSLSPALFLILEFFILLPSLLFSFGFLLAVFQYAELLRIVVSSSSTGQNIGITIISPLAGGFFAYQYIERYHAVGYVKKIAKTILAYSIIEIGLVTAYYILHFIPGQ